MLMILNLIFINSLFLIFMKHPLSCGLILLIQTIEISMITGMLNYNFWYSYILFLIMIGGLLILFIYMTSIASNEKFKFNLNMLIMMILMLIFTLYMDNYYQIMTEYSNMYNNYINMFNSFMKYMNFPNFMLTMIMMIYLFITLILVVKITKSKYGPLRQKF
uniref:NADH-ubiquinone oxidoreductase chain 6 n=1 Tax=Chaetocnema paganettii TaxID=1425541 RepID=A0A3G1GS69_9CUCU|nr:NADH dehydrogenase subunit 6 [Chaetocnema paganettii]